MVRRLLSACLLLALAACSSHQDAANTAPVSKEELAPAPTGTTASSDSAGAAVRQHLADYATVKLSADLSKFDAKQKKMIALLVEAADSMNAIYWQQAWGDKNALLQKIADPATREFVEINYGPWDRLGNDQPFVDGIGARPAGAQFYPADMDKAEFERSSLKDKTSLYTLLRRDAQGQLITLPYHDAYKAELEKAAGLLRDAAKLSQGCRLQEIPDAARRRAAQRRLPGQRFRLDGHEEQPGRHRDRPDRDLRGPAVRLQGQL